MTIATQRSTPAWYAMKCVQMHGKQTILTEKATRTENVWFDLAVGHQSTEYAKRSEADKGLIFHYLGVNPMQEKYCNECGPTIDHSDIIALGVCQGKKESLTLYICEQHFEEREAKKPVTPWVPRDWGEC